MENILNSIPTIILSIWIYMTSLYLISVLIKRTDIVDIGWGLGFILVALVSVLRQEYIVDRQIIMLIMVFLWGIRLAIHIYSRNKGKGEDYRYQKFKDDWGKSFFLQSYFKIFLLQGFFMFVISIPIITISSFTIAEITILDVIGIGIWLTGFLIETLSDIQLNTFIKLKKDNKTKERFADIGFWKYSRHPNYFGEILQWFGIWFLSSSTGYGYISILGPLLITYLILFVSGIPLLEKKFSKDDAWPEYVSRTRKIIPLPKF